MNMTSIHVGAYEAEIIYIQIYTIYIHVYICFVMTYQRQKKIYRPTSFKYVWDLA